MSRTRLSYLALALVLGGALVVGSRSDPGPPTVAGRAARIAEGVRCPTCDGLAVSESDAPASAAIRGEIRRRLDAGESDDEVRAFLVGRYGRDILLTPAGTGLAALVWALPVAVLVGGAGGLALVAARRRARPLAVPTAEDRLLVERARRR